MAGFPSRSGCHIRLKTQSALLIFAAPQPHFTANRKTLCSCEPYFASRISPVSQSRATLETFDPLPSLSSPLLGDVSSIQTDNTLSPLPDA